jgi:hypothetical protein
VNTDIEDTMISDKEDQLVDDSINGECDSLPPAVINTSINELPLDDERNTALFLMRVSNELSLGHSGIDKLCYCTQSFVESVADSISKNVQRVLNESGINDRSILTNVANACRPDDSFGNLTSRHYREKYYETNFHYVVSVFSSFFIILLYIRNQNQYALAVSGNGRLRMDRKNSMKFNSMVITLMYLKQ